jgi:hypothetical protein
MPKIKIEGKMLGIIARIDKLNDLKINKNIILESSWKYAYNPLQLLNEIQLYLCTQSVPC